MRPDIISNRSAIESYQFLQTTWKNTHPNTIDTEGQPVFPTEFSGLLQENSKFFGFFTSTAMSVPAIKSTELHSNNYFSIQSGQSESALTTVTWSLIAYACQYATRRENSFLRRDKNRSYPRNQLLKYTISTAQELSTMQISQELLKRYEEESLFTSKIINDAHTFFPTSKKNDGRTGFHATLMDINKCWTALTTITATELKRKTLKEKIENLSNVTNIIIFDLIKFIALTINNEKIEIFNIDSFYRKIDSYEEYKKTSIGILMKLLIEKYYTEQEISKDFSNHFFEEIENITTSLIKNQPAGIPKEFIHYRKEISAFLRLHGIALELIYLHKILKKLTEISGLAGDYSITHNEKLCASLLNTLHAWENLISEMHKQMNVVIKVENEQLEYAPANTSHWVTNYRNSKMSKENISVTISDAKGLIANIQNTASQLKALGLGEYQKQLEQTVLLTDQYTAHLERLGIMPPPAPSLHQSVSSPPTVTIMRRQSESIFNAPTTTAPIPRFRSAPSFSITAEWKKSGAQQNPVMVIHNSVNQNRLLTDFMTLANRAVPTSNNFYQCPNTSDYAFQETELSMKFDHTWGRFLHISPEDHALRFMHATPYCEYFARHLKLASLYDFYQDLYHLIEYIEHLKKIAVLYGDFQATLDDPTPLSEEALQCIRTTRSGNKFLQTPFISFKQAHTILQHAAESIAYSFQVAEKLTSSLKDTKERDSWKKLIGQHGVENSSHTITNIMDSLQLWATHHVNKFMELETACCGDTVTEPENNLSLLEITLNKQLEISKLPPRNAAELTQLKTWKPLSDHAKKLIQCGVADKEKDTYKGQGYRKGTAIQAYIDQITQKFLEKKEGDTELLQLLSDNYKPTYCYLKSAKSHAPIREMQITHKRRKNYHYLLPCLWQNSEASETQRLFIQFKAEVAQLLQQKQMNVTPLSSLG